MKNIQKTLKPTGYYLLLITAFYILRDVMLFPFVGILIIIPFFVILVSPIILLFWNIKLMRSNAKNKDNWSIFAISSIPGFLLGIQLAYGLHLMGHGSLSTSVIIPFLLLGLFVGLIFGLIGLLSRYLF